MDQTKHWRLSFLLFAVLFLDPSNQNILDSESLHTFQQTNQNTAFLTLLIAPFHSHNGGKTENKINVILLVLTHFEHFIERYLKEKSVDIVEKVKKERYISDYKEQEDSNQEEENQNNTLPITVPFFGEIDAKAISLPLITHKERGSKLYAVAYKSLTQIDNSRDKMPCKPNLSFQ